MYLRILMLYIRQCIGEEEAASCPRRTKAGIYQLDEQRAKFSVCVVLELFVDE